MTYKDHLEALKSTLQAAIASSQQDVGQEERDNVESSILELQQGLFKQTSFKSSQSLALQRLQMGGSLLEVMFNDDAPIDKGAKEQIKALIAQQRDLTAEILAHQKHCEELQEEQETIQGERREVTTQNRALMSQLKELQRKSQQPKEDGHKKLQEDLEKTEGYLSIIRNVLQGLIVGSSVNWAEDPKLQELLLSLGDKSP
ncbi:centromere protein H-like isoform X2 [Apostichopus japonicus]|uniref:centromere protein H-like isoform X2 n=1 Tax=Stichopus japonicus TaxID=307972 RepID=UPI003AB476B2